MDDDSFWNGDGIYPEDFEERFRGYCREKFGFGIGGKPPSEDVISEFISILVKNRRLFSDEEVNRLLRRDVQALSIGEKNIHLRDVLLGQNRVVYARLFNTPSLSVMMSGLLEDRMYAVSPGYAAWIDSAPDHAVRDNSRLHRRLSQWAASGWASLRLEKSQCAQLMFLDAVHLLDQIEPPWPTFLIKVAPGLIFLPNKLGHDVPLIDISVNVEENVDPGDPSRMWDIAARFGAHEPFYLTALVRQHGLYEEILGVEDGVLEVETRDLRTLRLIRRLVANSCLYLMDHKALRLGKGPHGKKKRKRGEPEVEEFVIGLESKIDFSSSVSDYVSGDEERIRKVQWIVRGHVREQPCGPGFSERKRIWIQAYWKGLEKASILVRDRVLSETSEA